MEDNLSQLQEIIKQIESLKGKTNWGPEFQLWLNQANKLVKEIFGDEGFALFKQQRTTTTSYIDKGFNIRQYHKELDNRKKILEGLSSNIKPHQPTVNSSISTPQDILKEIWKKDKP